MTDTEKLTLLIGVLKTYAEQKHCYDREEDSYEYPPHSWDVFDDGADYGEILFARTLLEQIGVEFEYPCMKEDTRRTGTEALHRSTRCPIMTSYTQRPDERTQNLV